METMGSLDLFALGWFILCWVAYSLIADHPRLGGRSLVGISHGYREQWIRRLVARENQIVDSGLVGNLMQSVSFFASTTIYIIAGLIAVMGTMDRAISFASDLPLVRGTTRELWEIKLLLLLVIFVYAYFKFTWALRQFNLLSILIGGAPAPGTAEALQQRYVERAAKVNSSAGDEFNRGVRAYYFGLAALAWFLQPWLFIGVTALVVAVLFRRDYASETLRVLRE